MDTETGEITGSWSTDDQPDGVLHVRCKDRRASRCKPCSLLYQDDAYQLTRAGLAGGKGVPESVQAHPGDYGGAVAWNHHASELWRRTTIRVYRELAHLLGRSESTVKRQVRLSYVKVAEWQRRGLIHFHAAVRLDAKPQNDGDTEHAPPPEGYTPDVLNAAIRAAVARVSVPYPLELLSSWSSPRDLSHSTHAPHATTLTMAATDAHSPVAPCHARTPARTPITTAAATSPMPMRRRSDGFTEPSEHWTTGDPTEAHDGSDSARGGRAVKGLHPRYEDVAQRPLTAPIAT